MGWDAFSTIERKYVDGKVVILGENHRIAFKRASDRVSQLAGSVDSGLSSGCLCLRESGKMIGKALYNSYTPPSSAYSGEKSAIELMSQCDWNFEYDEDKAVYYWSAKLFLKTCSDLGLNVWFSY